MENYKQTKKLEGIIAGCMVFFVVVIVFAICSFVSLGKARRKNAEYDQMIASLKTEQTSLEGNINYVETNYEEIAREQLGMIKKGEKLYIFK